MSSGPYRKDLHPNCAGEGPVGGRYAGVRGLAVLAGEPERPAGGGGERNGHSELLRALEARENTARITLDDSATSAAVLGRLLTALREDRYDYHVAVETEF